MKTAEHDELAISEAVISPDGKYRYKLGRYWDREGPPAIWIMLNPSTADSKQDDPTIRRCISFARRWGFGGIEVYNLFALRSPDPATIDVDMDPIGPDNDYWLAMAAQGKGEIIVAWGSCRTRLQLERATDVMMLLFQGGSRSPASLGLTRTGQPKHPLYVRGDTQRCTLRTLEGSENLSKG